MKFLQMIIFLVAINSYSQNNSKIDIENLKSQIIENKIALDSLGIDFKNKLNFYEEEIINLLNDEKIDFNNKKMVFVTGSLGKSIINKQFFFKDFKNNITKNNLLSFSIIKLNANQKENSGFDYIIAFWVKTFNPNSKKLLKELNKISHKY